MGASHSSQHSLEASRGPEAALIRRDHQTVRVSSPSDPDRVCIAMCRGLVRWIGHDKTVELRRPLSKSERETLELRRGTIAKALGPVGPAGRGQAGAAVARLLMLFPSLSAQSGETAMAITAAYVEQVERFPLWAVQAACAALARGGARQFAPTGPEFIAAVDDAVAPLRREDAEIARVLAAQADAPPQPVDDAVAARIRQLVGEWKARNGRPDGGKQA